MAEARRRNWSGRARRERGAAWIRPWISALLVAVALASLGGALGLGSSPAGAAEPAPTAVTVRIRDDGPDPVSANAEAGGTVIWINDTDGPASIVATDASFMSGPLEPGEQYQFAFTEERSVTYEIPEIPGAAGTVVVGVAAGTTTDPLPVPVPAGPPAAAPQAVPTTEFAYTGASSAVNALMGGLILALGAGLLALAHRLGWTAALRSWSFANVGDDLLPSRRHRRVRKEQARRGSRQWERSSR